MQCPLTITITEFNMWSSTHDLECVEHLVKIDMGHFFWVWWIGDMDGCLEDNEPSTS